MKNNKISSLSKGEVIIYKSAEGDTAIDVKFEEETLWLTHQQIAALFGRDRSVITRHIENILRTKELDEKSNVQKMHIPNSDKPVKFYNLDVILSVGYRVNSKRGTQFRIWANKILKEYLIEGYALNEKRLKEQTGKIKELEKSLEIFKRIADTYQLEKDELAGILNVISDYTYALDILDRYDHQQLSISKPEKKEEYRIIYEDAKLLIKNLKKKFSSSTLFGKEKDESLKSTVGTIYQTFNKKELYPSIEEKAECFCI
jgi:phage regulator Rha-like protein